MAKIKRRAVFFSIVSLLIIIVFVISTQLVTQFRVAETELEVTRTRVKILNEIVNDMEQVYFDRILYMSSKNALEGISEYYSINYNDANDYSNTLRNALNMTIYDGVYRDREGTHNLTRQGCSGSCLHEEYTFNKLLDSIKEELDFLGIDLQLSMKITNVEQVDPWNLLVTGEFDYYFKDKNEIASWKGFTERKVKITIYGFHDPTSPNNPITSEWQVDSFEDGFTEPSLKKKLEGWQQVSTFDKGVCSSGC